jgi:5-methylcytosine-specific restriction enzyme A
MQGDTMTSLSLSSGQILSNEELVNLFKCGSRGGMRRSKKTNTLVIIFDHTKPFYRDRWEQNVFHYTGMGLIGDQCLTFAQNKTLSESDTNGIGVHLFEVFEEGRYAYQGQVKLAGKPYQENQPDYRGNIRAVWIFPLRLIEGKGPVPIEEGAFQKAQVSREKYVRKLSDEELVKRVSTSQKETLTQRVVSNRYVRNEYVTELVKRKATGKCQLCSQPAPFNDRKNNPYLEVHHVTWLSNDGEDTVENTVALCPNCHRKMHVLNLEKDKEYLLKRANYTAQKRVLT